MPATGCLEVSNVQGGPRFGGGGRGERGGRGVEHEPAGEAAAAEFGVQVVGRPHAAEQFVQRVWVGSGEIQLGVRLGEPCAGGQPVGGLAGPGFEPGVGPDQIGGVPGVCVRTNVSPGGVAPFSLVRLFEQWVEARDDARAAAVVRSGPFQLQVGSPPLPAVALQRRTGLLERVTQTVTGAGVMVRSVAVGDGGVGKTQLARAVWDRARPGNTAGTRVRVWVDATTRSSIVSAYAAAAVQIAWCRKVTATTIRPRPRS
jgi:hypothetical protein